MTVAAQIRARILAVKRRFAILRDGEFNPYQGPPLPLDLSPSDGHVAAYESAERAAAWSNAGDTSLSEWQEMARARLVLLLGLPSRRVAGEIIHDQRFDTSSGLRRRRLYLRRPQNSDMPVNVVWQGDVDAARPVMICLQGTNSGAHLSWGEALMPADPIKIEIGADYAVQAAREGYIAVCLEQSCFGERQERRYPGGGLCATAANHALLIGRTLVGERVEDVSAVIDWIEAGGIDLPVDLEQLHIMGSSSGGTTAVYAAATDQRIGAVLASGCTGYVRETIGRRRNDQGQAVVPGFLKWFEFDDIVALVAPRPFLGIAGRSDHIFPFQQCEAVVDSARTAYEAAGAGELIDAVPGHAGHRFYPEIAWPAFRELLNRARLAKTK